MLLSTYAHLIDEYADRQPIDAEAEIAKAHNARVPECVVAPNDLPLGHYC